MELQEQLLEVCGAGLQFPQFLGQYIGEDLQEKM